MRRPNWGVLRINLALSLSYNPNTGTTQGFLLGCSDFQLMYIRQQLTQLASLASHPALIPTLISCYVCSLLENSVSDLWSKLLKVEWESGQTGIQMHDALGRWPASENKDYTALTKDALGIAQLATTRQSSADTLIQSIDSVQECLKYVNSVAPPQRKDAVNSASTAIEEQLRLATENAKELLSRSQFIKERTQTQITAIYNLIAQNDSLTNRGLAVDSHAMAVASRRDSSAMKAIGLLTMVFLPATFIATLFAMPIFQWNAEPGTSVVSDRFWVYWAVTLPLTAIVVLVWLAWLRLTTRNRPAPRDKAGKTRFGDSRPKIDNFDLETQAHRHDPSTYSRGILKMRHDCPTAMREGVAPRKCISGNDVSRRASSSSQCTKAKAKGVEPQHCRPPPRSQAAEPQGNAKANGSPNSESSVAESFGNLKVEFRTGLSESEQRAILEEIRDVKAFFKEGTVEADDGRGGRVPRDAGTGDPCGDTRGPADRVGGADGGWEEFDVHVAGVLPPGWGDDHGDAVGGVGE
ncbi:hypothetical protein FNYG_14626 [Fusarium nygamai]|uniref:Uncharacterized protein n=1 Tax=Gibberella nygamai TaxID=42673 RepID=A0A2K0US81_GIBNY|nr:hypothetical protein FNYG_14626 [Fusarium nygamai]